VGSCEAGMERICGVDRRVLIGATKAALGREVVACTVSLMGAREL
jgi:hypothetical protein